MSMLAELIAAGTPAPIRTPYPTRQHPDCVHPRLLVQCPGCHDWNELTHNAYCHTCAIWLVEEQAAPAVVVATEPVAPPVVAALVASDADEVLSLDFELDVTKDTLTAADYAMATPEQIAAWRAARKSVEQDALIAELAFEADAVIDRERHVAIREGKYVLWCRRSDMMAVDCSCGDRVHRGRRAGRACKHQMAHNAPLKTAEAA